MTHHPKSFTYGGLYKKETCTSNFFDLLYDYYGSNSLYLGMTLLPQFNLTSLHAHGLVFMLKKRRSRFRTLKGFVSSRCWEVSGNLRPESRPSLVGKGFLPLFHLPTPHRAGQTLASKTFALKEHSSKWK